MRVIGVSSGPPSGIFPSSIPASVNIGAERESSLHQAPVWPMYESAIHGPARGDAPLWKSRWPDHRGGANGGLLPPTTDICAVVPNS
jgi:hypothetical protein